MLYQKNALLMLCHSRFQGYFIRLLVQQDKVRVSGTETVDFGSIPGLIKPKTYN